MSDMKLRLVDHSAYNVEYVEEDTLTIAVALVSCLITILLDLLWPPSQNQSSSSKSPVNTMSTTRDSSDRLNATPELEPPGTGSKYTTILRSSTARPPRRSTSTRSGKSLSHQQKVELGTNGVNPSKPTEQMSQPSVSSTRSNASENALLLPNSMPLLINQPSAPQQTTSPST